MEIKCQLDASSWHFISTYVRTEFVPRNTTVDSEYYKGLLEHLRNDGHRKQPEKWANGFILHHDNATCHTSLLVQQFLSNKNITVCPHPPYSPDLAPCDFWLFLKVKMTLKGKRFEWVFWRGLMAMCLVL